MTKPKVCLGDRRIMLSEAAMLARMNRERLLRVIQAGHIRAELVAGRWLVSRSSLQDYLAAQSAGQ